MNSEEFISDIIYLFPKYLYTDQEDISENLYLIQEYFKFNRDSILEIDTINQLLREAREKVESLLLSIPDNEREVLNELYMNEGKKHIGIKIKNNHIIGLAVIGKENATLPNELTHLTELKELILSDLTGIPPIIFEIKQLTRLSLSITKRHPPQVPEQIRNLINLEYLCLRGIKLRTHLEWIGDLQSLKELHLLSSSLRSLPTSIKMLKGLRVLSFCGENVTGLHNLEGLSNLEELYIYDKMLEIIPESIFKLSNLRDLNLKVNKLKDISCNIGSLNSLQKLDLSNNDIKFLPDSIGQLVSLRELILSNNKLPSLPDSIGQLVNLPELDLSSNELSCLPESIGHLVNLRELNLYNNKLHHLPESFSKMRELRILDLSLNKNLDSLPRNFDELVNLQKLFLSNTKIISGLKYVTKLPNLIELDLSDNYYPVEKLLSLLEDIGQLSQLEILKLPSSDYREFLSLSETVTQLTNLTELNFGNNEFSVLSDPIRNWLLDLYTHNKCQIIGVSIQRIRCLSTIPVTEKKFIEELESQVGLLVVGFEETQLYCGCTDNYFEVTDGHITELYVEDRRATIPESIAQLTHLKELTFISETITELPENMIKLTKLNYLCLSSNLKCLSNGLSQWLLKLEQNGCTISGISMARIKALQGIPPEEKEFIEKLEAKFGVFPLWEEVKDNPPDRGGIWGAFFEVKNNHVSKLRLTSKVVFALQSFPEYPTYVTRKIDDSREVKIDIEMTNEMEDELRSISEFFSLVDLLADIDHLTQLKELTLASFYYERQLIEELIQEKFPDRFVIEYGETGLDQFSEHCFFLNDGKERSPLKYWGEYS